MAFDRRAASTQSQRALNSPIRPVIFRPTIGRLVHPHARELHKARFRVLPDPDGDIFHRLIFPVPGLHSGNGDRASLERRPNASSMLKKSITNPVCGSTGPFSTISTR